MCAILYLHHVPSSKNNKVVNITKPETPTEQRCFYCNAFKCR